jgi:alpha-ketoglutarate-dependent taurine dioxygenase
MVGMRTTPITGPAVWTGRDLADETQWTRHFEDAHRRELDTLLTRLSGGSGPARPNSDFPSLAALLRDAHHDLTHGRGFVRLRGFPIDRYSLEETEKLFLGLGRFLGTPISQNSYGDLLGHVRDEGKRFRTTTDTKGARGYLSNEALLFHTDLGDVAGLLCVQKAIEGGMSSVSSSMAVYNIILAEHPEYLPAYYNGFAFRSIEADGAPTEWRLPIFTYHHGILSCAIRRMAIETARINGVPYTDLENAALEYLDRTAARQDLRLDMHLDPGDIQLLNNYVTFHARTNFVDADEPAKKRHLLRLWLQLPDGRSFLRAYPTIYDGIPCTLKR